MREGVVDGEPVVEGDVVRLAVSEEERVVRAVADPVRVPAIDLLTVAVPDGLRVVVCDSVGLVEGEPDTVSPAVPVGECELVTVFVSVGDPVVVRVVDTLLEVVPEAVGLAV